MTYETKNITFHMICVKVSNDSRCSRTLLMNVIIWSNMIKGKALYQSVILRPMLLLSALFFMVADSAEISTFCRNTSSASSLA